MEFVLQKVGEGECWPRPTYNPQKFPWLKVDFDKIFYDGEDEENEEADPVCNRSENLLYT